MKKKIFKGLCILMLSGSFAIGSCSKSSNNYNSSSSGATNTPAPANTINLYGMAFSPATLTVKAGTAITWNNNDNTVHTITADDNSFDSGNLAVGKTFVRVFPTAGSYPYHCTFHSVMTGTIVVQ
jgi:plastocyanin